MNISDGHFQFTFSISHIFQTRKTKCQYTENLFVQPLKSDEYLIINCGHFTSFINWIFRGNLKSAQMDFRRYFNYFWIKSH